MQRSSNEESAQAKRMNKDLFFPTPIYFTDIQGFEALNRSMKKHIYDWRAADPYGTMRSNMAQLGAWHSPTDMHVRAEYNPLTAEIFEFVHGIYNELGYDNDFEPVCDSMWVNINPRYAYNREHTHPHALWSGVYYVQTPENCGLLYFLDPRAQAQALPPYYDAQRRRAESWHEVHYQPQEGRMIVFPAWLTHAVQPNLSALEGPEGDRISVSFNFYQRRREEHSRSSYRREIVRADLDP